MSEIQYGLSGMTAAVTGGSRGIGLDIARRLLAEGARVAVCARKSEGLDMAAKELESRVRDAEKMKNFLPVSAHVGKPEGVDLFFSRIKERFGGLDILINNVGMNIITTASDADAGLWKKIIDTNLNGAFLCAKSAGAMMKEGGGGAMVNITSIAAKRAAPAMGIYGVAKAGIEMMTKVLASELAPFRIRVNAVAPSMVRTGFSKPFWSNDELLAQIQSSIPLGRIAEVSDVADPVLFLCSKAAGFITGQVLAVDGGATAV
jgi:2-deoxy-D-gluconate 3-dehydrogenase